MEKPTHEFPCKAEELPILGDFLKTSFERDKTTFAKYSPDFNDTYLAAFGNELSAADGLINSSKFLKEQKAITARNEANASELRTSLDLLQGYTKRAKAKLTIAPSDFGISPLRKKLAVLDLEGVISAFDLVLKNVEENVSALQEKGFSPEAHTGLINLRNTFKADNKAQNDKQNERSEHVQKNIALLNTLWARMQDVMKTGKILFKSTDASKLDDYTMTELKKRVKQERKKPTDKGDSADSSGEAKSWIFLLAAFYFYWRAAKRN